MRTLFVFVCPVLLGIFLASCGGARKYQEMLALQQQQLQQQQVQQQQLQQQAVQQQQEQSVQPKRQKREVDECILLANEEGDFCRAYGEGTSFREGVALENAEMDAVVRIVQQFQSTVEGVRERYRGTAAKNLSTADEERLQGIIKQYLSGKASYRVLKTSLYDLSDGTVQCYVCIEYRTPKETMTKELTNVLSDDGVLGIEFNRDRFAASIKEDWDNYKRQQAETQK